jgi:hypothetical protein
MNFLKWGGLYPAKSDRRNRATLACNTGVREWAL